MIEKTVRGGYDTWVEEDHASKAHPKDTALHLKVAAAYALLYMNNPVPKGAIVVSGTLRTHARGNSTGGRVVTAERLAGKFDPKKTTWDTKPGVVGVAAATDVGTLHDGDPIDNDVTDHLQTWAGGAPNRGWRIKTTDDTVHKLYSLNAGKHAPVLIVKYAWRPDAPTNLTSSGGDVSVAKPVLQFDYNEASGTSDLAAIQVQIDPDADGGDPAWDSGEVITTVPELALAATSYPGLANGASTKWRVRAKSDDGYWSPWSDWVSFARTPKGVLEILTPGPDAPFDVVTESTPPFLWSFTDQVAYRAVLTLASDRTRFLHNTKKQPGPDQSWTPPKHIITTPGVRYSLGVRVWDSTPRIATTGDPTYVEQWRDFTFTLDTTQDPATDLSVRQIGRTPCAEITAHRDTPPDSWSLMRNGEVIESDIDPEDVFVAPGTVIFRDWTAPAFTPLEYEAVPVVNRKAITGGPTATARLRLDTLWVVDPINEWRFCLLNPQQDFHYGEDSEERAKFDYVARKISSIRGLEGTASGVLVESEFDPRPLAVQLADVLAIKERPLNTYRVCVADLNFPAEVGRVDPAPSSDFIDGVEQRAMAFSAWQNGELPFKAQA